MTMTAHRYTAAFNDEKSRELYFSGCETHRILPEPGTAMRHVLGCNLGIWGDRNALKDDAAHIMMYELAAWADRNRVENLRMDAQAIGVNRLFHQAFKACAQVNLDEIDDAVRAMSDTPRTYPVATVPEQYIGEDFTSELYKVLARRRPAYLELQCKHFERMVQEGFR